MTETLKVIPGSMFSGKTDILIKEVRRAEIAGRVVQVFKPTVDNRWGETDKICSRSGAEHEAISVKKSVDILENISPDTDTVAIDEVQFFDQDIVSVVQILLEADIKVIGAGLPLDFRGEPFGSMPILLSLCDDIEKTTAICTEVVNGKKCGAEATRSQRLINGQPANYNDPIVLIGDAEEGYQARCVKHHKVPDKPIPKINKN
jgi:thymidine kinase